MRIQRSNPTTRFVVLPNETAQNHALSFTARGILAYLVSLPDGAAETVKTLAAKSREGRTAVTRAMQELEDAGYLRREAKRVATGFSGTELVISDVPAGEAERPEMRAPGSSGDETLKNLSSKNPNPTPEAPAAPVGSGSVEMTESEKALAGLAAIDGRLHLTAADVAALTPLADEWFARGADGRQFAAVLTLALPETINRPAAFLRRRLTDKMPAARPVVAAVTAPQAARHLCPECERPKASEGLCADCGVKEATPVETGSRNWRQMAQQFGVGALTI
jgi:DNA-binding MarR family transcriptional regulator